MNIVTKIRFHLCLIKHLFSGLHKWGIANDPATEDERFTETCFEERFGRRRQSQPKTSAPSVISGAIKQLVKIRVNLWLFNTRYAIRNTRPLSSAFCFCRKASCGLSSVIFNPIKKLTITRTGDNLKGRRVIWRLC